MFSLLFVTAATACDGPSINRSSPEQQDAYTIGRKYTLLTAATPGSNMDKWVGSEVRRAAENLHVTAQVVRRPENTKETLAVEIARQHGETVAAATRLGYAISILELQAAVGAPSPVLAPIRAVTKTLRLDRGPCATELSALETSPSRANAKSFVSCTDQRFGVNDPPT